MTATHGVREQIGEAIGGWWAPMIATVARLRHARMFHPDGIVCRGRLEVVVGTRYEALARRLGPQVLARLSGALFRGERRLPDVLGIALRFSAGNEPTAIATTGDQDLLFATIRSPLAMLTAPFTTRTHDFLANPYYAVSPFAIAGDERVELRLTPIDPPVFDGARADRLRAAVEIGHAKLALELRPVHGADWFHVATVALERDVTAEIDQDALEFDPFQTGAGIVPVGVIHAIRRAAYRASQLGRGGDRAQWSVRTSATSASLASNTK